MEGQKVRDPKEIVDESDGNVLFIVMILPNGMDVMGKKNGRRVNKKGKLPCSHRMGRMKIDDDHDV
jgi:hypothetical protein